jgi:hypothetical protein
MTLAPRNISVPARRASSIIREYGEPLFVKIDVEFVDHVVLRDLLMHAIKPPYISAEAHLIDVYCFLVCIGYEKFKLVDGETDHVKFSIFASTVPGPSARMFPDRGSTRPFAR